MYYVAEYFCSPCNVVDNKTSNVSKVVHSFQTPSGVSSATERLLTILKVAAGLVPMATAVYLSSLTRCTELPDIDQPSFD